MRKILVTGGAGFIGTNLVGRLLELGDEVYSVDNFVIGERKHAEIYHEYPNYHFIEMDIDDADAFCERFKEMKFDTIFHLAANSDIKKGGQNPQVDYRDTFSTTRSVLELMRRNSIKKLFFASTSAI